MPNSRNVTWVDWMLVPSNLALGYYFRGTVLGFVLVVAAILHLFVMKDRINNPV
jgi:hypothetical protein